MFTQLKHNLMKDISNRRFSIFDNIGDRPDRDYFL